MSADRTHISISLAPSTIGHERLHLAVEDLLDTGLSERHIAAALHTACSVVILAVRLTHLPHVTVLGDALCVRLAEGEEAYDIALFIENALNRAGFLACNLIDEEV